MSQKAPGKANRKGISLVELLRKFPDDATAERWFSETRWPHGPACPHCGSTNAQSGASHPTMPYRCRERECRKRFSVKTGTVMQASNLGCQVWAIAIYLCLTSLKSVSSMKLHRDLEITQKSAWHLAHRLRKAGQRQLELPGNDNHFCRVRASLRGRLGSRLLEEGGYDDRPASEATYVVDQEKDGAGNGGGEVGDERAHGTQVPRFREAAERAARPAHVAHA